MNGEREMDGGAPEADPEEFLQPLFEEGADPPAAASGEIDPTGWPGGPPAALSEDTPPEGIFIPPGLEHEVLEDIAAEDNELALRGRIEHLEQQLEERSMAHDVR